MISRFISKYRICRRYSTRCGNWYVIQGKFLWHWFTLNYAFDDLGMANNVLFCLEHDIQERKEDICETVLYRNEHYQFIDEYPCKTNV